MKLKDQIQELREQLARLTIHLVNKNEVLRDHRNDITQIKDQHMEDKMGVRKDIDALQNEIARVQSDICALIDAQNKRIEALNTLFTLTRQDIKDLSAKIPKKPTGQD